MFLLCWYLSAFTRTQPANLNTEQNRGNMARNVPYSGRGRAISGLYVVGATASGTGKIGRRQHIRKDPDISSGSFLMLTGASLNMRHRRIFDRLRR